MRINLSGRRYVPLRQPFFAFMERRLQHERLFKWLIVITTCLVIGLMLRIMPWGRYISDSVPSSARQAARQVMGVKKPRTEVDAEWRRYRQLGIDTVRSRAERFYAEADPPYQRLIRYAGMDPEHMLLRWGNYNWTLLLSSKVFELDDNGRAYRFRPLTRSIWLLNVPRKEGGPMFFLVPDGPGLADAIKGIRADPLESSRQTTNSWGLRGPEPDPNAPVRGIVLGDSYMQGMFIGDGESPPDRLERYLRHHLKTRVSILNGGVMGYSPEQYYYTLVAFADRFHPHFVVVGVFLNDFGDTGDVGDRGIGDWQEGKYWLERIAEFCQKRQWPYLIVPAPFVTHLLMKRKSGYYPGTLSNILEVDPLKYLYPIEDFANAQLRLINEAKRRGEKLDDCPLYNGPVGDSHFSAAGSEVWAAAVGRRLILLLDRESAMGDQSTAVAGNKN
jgi:hypothetical protein